MSGSYLTQASIVSDSIQMTPSSSSRSVAGRESTVASNKAVSKPWLLY
jgi:hypothetical protein